jgi:hypothetical protein
MPLQCGFPGCGFAATNRGHRRTHFARAHIPQPAAVGNSNSSAKETKAEAGVDEGVQRKRRRLQPPVAHGPTLEAKLSDSSSQLTESTSGMQSGSGDTKLGSFAIAVSPGYAAMTTLVTSSIG